MAEREDPRRLARIIVRKTRGSLHSLDYAKSVIDGEQQAGRMPAENAAAAREAIREAREAAEAATVLIGAALEDIEREVERYHQLKEELEDAAESQ